MPSAYENSYFNVKVDNGILPLDNKLGDSAILPVTPDGKVILLKIYRAAIESYSLEIPRGFAEAGEVPIETERREIMEEIAGKCKKLSLSVPCTSTPV
jgi:ADP-ribose pyrophosphatase